MARRNLTDRLIDRGEISEDIVLIKDSDVDYVTRSCKVYCDYGYNKFLKKTCFVNKANGYVYVSICGNNGKQAARRLHKIVAEAFIPNDDVNKNIVMHLDNDKTNNNVENLKWGTISENTQQAVDDGLIVNKKGFEDERSLPIIVFNIDGTLKKIYGSVSIAAQEENVTKTGILYQAKHKVKNTTKLPRTGRYFRFLEEYQKCGFVL